ncbi:hypothetical protein HMN09_00451400 [Mycena chlorophos]|uniref:Uncharacterized protein n=1 Tax=Mycena chlorophos TaxID=658473 RepID=A0A8H6TE49_MYCCL|nr:hypothetical protein HMN09_00451400 [Mycena chlorophos]
MLNYTNTFELVSSIFVHALTPVEVFLSVTGLEADLEFVPVEAAVKAYKKVNHCAEYLKTARDIIAAQRTTQTVCRSTEAQVTSESAPAPRPSVAPVRPSPLKESSIPQEYTDHQERLIKVEEAQAHLALARALIFAIRPTSKPAVSTTDTFEPTLLTRPAPVPSPLRQAAYTEEDVPAAQATHEEIAAAAAEYLEEARERLFVDHGIVPQTQSAPIQVSPPPRFVSTPSPLRNIAFVSEPVVAPLWPATNPVVVVKPLSSRRRTHRNRKICPAPSKKTRVALSPLVAVPQNIASTSQDCDQRTSAKKAKLES